MDSAAEKLMLENMGKNAIDYEEYPATVDLQNRCGEPHLCRAKLSGTRTDAVNRQST